MSPEDAAVAGAKRMWVPVLTSSLTTMAAFLPLLIMGGIMGDMVLALPTVLLCVIAASLIECFWVLPGHLRVSLANMKPPTESWRTRFEARFFQFRDERFMPLVESCLARPGITLVAACAAMTVALSLVISQHVGINFVTGFDFESIEANVEFASTASEAEKASFMAHLETTLAEVDQATDQKNIVGWVTKYNRARLNNDRWHGEQYAALAAQYAFEEDRTDAPKDFASAWREKVQRPPYV